MDIRSGANVFNENACLTVCLPYSESFFGVEDYLNLLSTKEELYNQATLISTRLPNHQGSSTFSS